MLPSLKVKSLRQGSGLGGERGLRFGQPTRRDRAFLRDTARIGTFLVLSTNSAIAQRTVPPLANLDGYGVLPALSSSTAELSADVRLEVHQDPLANCPDASRIRDALFAQRVNASPGRQHVMIAFQRRTAAVIAIIEARGVRVGSRELQLETDDCQALLQPLVVSLALLLDPDAEGAAAPNPVIAPGWQAGGNLMEPAALAGQNQGQMGGAVTLMEPIRPVSSSKQVPVGQRASIVSKTFPRAPNQTKNTAPAASKSKSMPARRHPRQTWREAASESPRGTIAFGFDLGPLLIAGLIPRTAHGLEFQGFARHGFLSLRVAAAGCASETLVHGNGRVRAQTYYGRLGLCGQWPARGPFSIALCQGSWLGRFVVQGSGFPTDRTASPWFVAVGGFFDAGWTVHEGFGAYLRGGGFAPLTRHRFNVDGVGSSAFHSQAFGAWVGLGGSWTFQ